MFLRDGRGDIPAVLFVVDRSADVGVGGTMSELAKDILSHSEVTPGRGEPLETCSSPSSFLSSLGIDIAEELPELDGKTATIGFVSSCSSFFGSS